MSPVRPPPTATFSTRPLLLRVLLVLSLLIGLLVFLPGCGKDETDVRVMSYNLYLGADISELVGVPAEEVPEVAARLFANVQATDFPTRSEAIAAHIQAREPALIGLQEVSLYRTQTPSDSVTGTPTPNATNVAFDFLEILLAELRSRGLDYRVVASTTNVDVEVPSTTDGSTFTDIRLTDRDVILARADVQVRNVVEENFAAALSLPIGGNPVDYIRGYNSLVATVDDVTFTFANAHLEVDDGNPQGAAGVQAAQASELLAALRDRPLPVILVGDFNSPADGSGTVVPELGKTTYGLLTDSYTDSFVAAGVEGATCCQAADLQNPTSTLEERIDLILYRGDVEVESVDLLGEELGDRIEGLWPSDHAGVVATLELEEQPASENR